MALNLERPLARPVSKSGQVRRRLTMEEILSRAAASLEEGPVKRPSGRFRRVRKGRRLTRIEKGLMTLMAGALGLSVWLHAQPEPVSAHTQYYQSLATTTPLEAFAPRSFAESALQAIGSDWRAATFFACVHPSFWQRDVSVHPDTHAARVEQGLARLAEHGPLVSAMSFPAMTGVRTETINGVDALAGQIAGQLELADGMVVRYTAQLVQDSATKRWGLTRLSIPGFLP